jgi:hypothetical protein
LPPGRASLEILARLGLPRGTLCQQFCRTDRMLRLWIELCNRGGIDAMITNY